MKKYVIIKNKKKIKTKIAGNKISGYRVLPKNSFEYPGIKVESLIIIKPSLIEKLLKKKIKRKLDYYLKYIISLIDDESGTSHREALDEISKYRDLVEYKYRLYLDDKYINILLKKISLIEYEIKTKSKTIKPKKEIVMVQNEEIEETRRRRR